MSPNFDHSWLCETIVAGSSDAIVFSDATGIIRLWNGGAEALFGFTAEEAVGQSLDIIIPENLRPRHWEGYRQVMATGETKYRTGMLAAPGQTKDGTRVSLEFSMSIIRDAGGAIVGCSSVLRDVTERWQKEREMKARLKELEQRWGEAVV